MQSPGWIRWNQDCVRSRIERPCASRQPRFPIRALPGANSRCRARSASSCRTDAPILPSVVGRLPTVRDRLRDDAIRVATARLDSALLVAVGFEDSETGRRSRAGLDAPFEARRGRRQCLLQLPSWCCRRVSGRLGGRVPGAAWRG
jgi:hypothetical protein